MNKSRNSKNAWTKEESVLLTNLYKTPGMSIKDITKGLKKSGYPRTYGAVSNRIHAMRLKGVKLTQAGGIKKPTGYKKGRVTSTTKTYAMPVAMTTGNVVIKHKMFTMTTTDDSITITVNS